MMVGAVGGIVLANLVALIIGMIGLGTKALPSTMAILILALTLLVGRLVLSWRDTTGDSNGIYVPAQE